MKLARCIAAAILMFATVAAPAQQRNVNFDLRQAARTGSAATVRALLDQGANPNPRNRLGDSPLNTAARNGSVRGADASARDNRGETALSLAVAEKQAEAAALLASAGDK